MKNWLLRKTVSSHNESLPTHQLKPTLNWFHLIALGVGAIVGTGILTLIGVGADKAGPAVIVSFIVAGVICACAALAYAEMATMIPISGGAYTYSYVVIGELIAWVIGWSLILEYSLVVSAGTLAAFTATTSRMLILRCQEPEIIRHFKAPLPRLTGAIAIIGCSYLFISLPQSTQLYFLIWNMMGFAVYLVYGSRRSLLSKNMQNQVRIDKHAQQKDDPDRHLQANFNKKFNKK